MQYIRPDPRLHGHRFRTRTILRYSWPWPSLARRQGGLRLRHIGCTRATSQHSRNTFVH